MNLDKTRYIQVPKIIVFLPSVILIGRVFPPKRGEVYCGASDIYR